MPLTRRLVAVLSTVVLTAAPLAFAPATAQAEDARATVSDTSRGLFDNCDSLHRRWPHGVGKRGARDKTTSGDPVRNFKRSNRIYAKAMRKNPDLDRDRDKIACESH